MSPHKGKILLFFFKGKCHTHAPVTNSSRFSEVSLPSQDLGFVYVPSIYLHDKQETGTLVVSTWGMKRLRFLESKFPTKHPQSQCCRQHSCFSLLCSLLRLSLLLVGDYPSWQHSFRLRAFNQAHMLFLDGMERPVNVYPEHFLESSSMGLAV